MGFADRYLRAVNSRNLQDDAHHRATEVLCAAALAGGGAGLGPLLARVKYADALSGAQHGAAGANLAQLLRLWTDRVAEKGRERRWVKHSTAWDLQAAQALYRRVAERSLAHWLDDRCGGCRGSGVTPERRVCAACEGSGRAAVEGGRFERDKVLDMAGELEGLLQAYCARAAARLRGGAES